MVSWKPIASSCPNQLQSESTHRFSVGAASSQRCPHPSPCPHLCPGETAPSAPATPAPYYGRTPWGTEQAAAVKGLVSVVLGSSFSWKGRKELKHNLERWYCSPLWMSTQNWGFSLADCWTRLIFLLLPMCHPGNKRHTLWKLWCVCILFLDHSRHGANSEPRKDGKKWQFQPSTPGFRGRNIGRINFLKKWNSENHMFLKWSMQRGINPFLVVLSSMGRQKARLEEICPTKG